MLNCGIENCVECDVCVKYENELDADSPEKIVVWAEKWTEYLLKGGDEEKLKEWGDSLRHYANEPEFFKCPPRKERMKSVITSMEKYIPKD